MWGWFRGGDKRRTPGHVPGARREPARSRLSLEPLEDRCLPSVTLFPIPSPNSQPEGITRGPDGNLYFAEIHAIGRITPTGQITEFRQGLSPASEPVEITAGPDGNVWFTEGVTDRIGRITPAGAITEFAVPGTGGRQVFVDGITAGPDGNIWFTEQAGAIGRITPTGVVTVFPTNSVGTLVSQPSLITAGPDGNIWWTDTAGFVGRITPTGVITKFAAGITDPINSEPFGITAGPDGNVWFTESGTDRIGRITPAGVITEFSTGITNHSVPAQIVAAADGNLWFSEVGLGQLGRITTAGVVTEFSAAFSAGTAPGEIAVGPDGNIWFTQLGGNQIGRFDLPGTPPPAQGGPTTTTLQSSLTTAVVGQAETLTATMTSQGGVPTGSVTFYDGNTVLGTASVNADGQAKLTVALGVGAHTLTASFAGTGGFTGSLSPATAVTVTRAGTGIALGSSVNPAVTGQAVTFTAAVFPVAPGGGTPSGTVTFKDGVSVLGTVAIGATGVAKLTTSFVPAGGHAITAVYSGDPNFVGSSRTIVEQVNAPATHKATTTALLASAKVVAVGQAVTFTATVRDPTGTGTPTGTVTFFLGRAAVATVKLDANGQAHLTGSFKGKGKFTLKAVYDGDALFSASSSQSLFEQVN
jgi:streptogramin lyase